MPVLVVIRVTRDDNGDGMKSVAIHPSLSASGAGRFRSRITNAEAFLG